MVPLGDIFATSMLSGLGEAMDGLPIALAALGHRCMVISPRSSALNAGKIRGAHSLLLPCSGYDQYKEAWDTGYWSSVPMGGKNESVHFFHTYKQKARCHSSMARQLPLLLRFVLAGRLRLRRSPHLPGACQRTDRPESCTDTPWCEQAADQRSKPQLPASAHA